MSFLHTLANLANKAQLESGVIIDRALNNAPGSIERSARTAAAQQAHPQGQPLNGQGLNLSGQGLQLQSMPGVSNAQPPSMLQQFAHPLVYEGGSGVNMGRLTPQQLNLGSPDYQSAPQSGFGPQVQQLGIGGGYQSIQPAPFNQGPQNLGHFNPQVKDNGFYWYQ